MISSVSKNWPSEIILDGFEFIWLEKINLEDVVFKVNPVDSSSKILSIPVRFIVDELRSITLALEADDDK